MTTPNTIRGAAIQAYADYMEGKYDWSKYDTRWEKLLASVRDGDQTALGNVIREACVVMFEAGVALRITGE